VDKASHADQTQAFLNEIWPRVFTGTVASLATVDHSNSTITTSALKPFVGEDATEDDSEIKGFYICSITYESSTNRRETIRAWPAHQNEPMRTT